MKSLSLIVGVVCLFAVTATAAPVTYSTVNSQLCVGATGCGVLSQTIGGVLSISFNPIASSTVLAEPATFGSFGEFVIACVGGGTACGTQSLAGLNLYLNIAQSAPTAGFGAMVAGVLTGSISGTASSAVVTWATPNAVSIGTVQYSVLNNPLGLVPPSVNGGVTSVQALITDSGAVPEPSTMILMGAGLAGLGWMRRRSSQQR